MSELIMAAAFGYSPAILAQRDVTEKADFKAK
jgi:hypothetical protein